MVGVRRREEFCLSAFSVNRSPRIRPSVVRGGGGGGRAIRVAILANAALGVEGVALRTNNATRLVELGIANKP